MDLMHGRYGYAGNTIDGIGNSNEDKDLVIKSIDTTSSDDSLIAKGLSMLRELE